MDLFRYIVRFLYKIRWYLIILPLIALVVAWFSTRDYADSNAVFTGRDATDIQSLMAVYTKDTASCFVKA